MLELLRKLHHLACINSVAQTLDFLMAILVLITGLVRVKAIRSQVVKILHVLEFFRLDSTQVYAIIASKFFDI